jgi:ABC-type sugar transport system permease subunit
MLPKYDWAGTIQYEKLFANDRWWVAAENLLIFGGLFIVICLMLGLFLAIFLDQKIRAEGAIRTIYLYPMALSFIVTGTAWKWILNPELGIQRMVREMGFESFTFDWLVNTEMAIYTVVIAGVWQSSGFVMALCLAGLRGVDDNIIKAARVDGASMPLIYRKIIIPGLRPVFFSALILFRIHTRIVAIIPSFTASISFAAGNVFTILTLKAFQTISTLRITVAFANAGFQILCAVIIASTQFNSWVTHEIGILHAVGAIGHASVSWLTLTDWNGLCFILHASAALY